MLMAAVAHKYAFTYKDYVRADAAPGQEDRMPFIWDAFIESSVPKEVLRDIRRALQPGTVGHVELRNIE